MASSAAHRRILALWFPRLAQDRAHRDRSTTTATAIPKLDVLRRWATRLSPRVALEPPSGLLVDLSGCPYPFGDEPGLLADAGMRCMMLGLSVRLAIADTPGAAWAVARHGGALPGGFRAGGLVLLRAVEGRGQGIGPTRPEGMIVPPGAARKVLMPLPLAALRLSPETLAGLRHIGLRMIGDIADLPRAALARRFGAGLVRRLDQAMGLEPEPIPEARVATGRQGVPALPRHRHGPGPALADLVAQLAARLGADRVTRLHPAQSQIPEKAALVLAAGWSEPAPAPWPAPRGLRPLTLHRPEALDAAADPMPPAGFGWRGTGLLVQQAAGPERIAPEWWLDDPDWRSGPRDYWRVETTAGDRLWLFYAHGSAVPGGWYCHGRFA